MPLFDERLRYEPLFQAVTFALFTKVFAISEGLLPKEARLNRLLCWVKLDVGLAVGALLLPVRVRDISNNLKLYRAEILKGLEINEDHFAANMETGLKPVLSGYDIQEIPISWINRTAEMGSSSFKLLQVGPGYLSALLRTIWSVWRGKRSCVKRIGAGDRQPSLSDIDLPVKTMDKPPHGLKVRAQSQDPG